MKKILGISLLMLFPLFAFSQSAQKDAAPAVPKKHTISSYRVWIKSDGNHDEAFRQALGAHAQKFHTGNWQWRVYQVLSGPDQGAYHIVEGPASWTVIDDRGTLGADHTKDYQANVQPHVERTSPDNLAVYVEALSSVAATQWSNKVLVQRITVKPGRGSVAYETLKTWKTVYAKRDLNVAVWSSFFSGESSYAVAFRLKNGLKDLDLDQPTFRKTVEDLFGPNEYARLQQAAADSYKEVVSEIIEFLPELSSK